MDLFRNYTREIYFAQKILKPDKVDFSLEGEGGDAGGYSFQSSLQITKIGEFGKYCLQAIILRKATLPGSSNTAVQIYCCSPG